MENYVIGCLAYENEMKIPLDRVDFSRQINECMDTWKLNRIVVSFVNRYEEMNLKQFSSY